MRSGILFFLVLTLHFSVFAYDWGTNPGDGSEENPYQISEPNHLMSIGSDPNLLDKHFILVNDIVFDPNNNPEHVFTEALIGPADSVGANLDFRGTPFSGTFNGNYHIISNFKIDAVSSNNGFLGLFGKINDLGIVKKVLIDNICIKGGDASDVIGAICGGNSGLVAHCSTTGSIQGGVSFGIISGFCGENNGSILNSNSACSVDSQAWYYIGGFCASNEGYIISCYSTGIVEGGDGANDVGNFCGFNSNVIRNCYSVGSVQSGDNSSNVGGFCGYHKYGHMSNCYSTGLILAGTGTADLGGLCGKVYTGITTNSFWNITSSNMTTSASGMPLNDPNMMIQSNFTNWDFLGESTNGENETWRMCIDDVDYPHLSWEFAKNGDFACGDGTDILDLQALAEHWLLSEALDPTTFSYACDANGDGVIDLADYSVMGENW